MINNHMIDSKLNCEVKEEQDPYQNYKQTLQDVLTNASRVRGSSFAIGGKITEKYFNRTPAISIERCGRLGFPLSMEQSRTVIQNATKAPYGKNFKTLINEDVRLAWQIEAEKVTIEPNFLRKGLLLLVDDVCNALGLNAEHLGAEAHFYKMLLYEAGGHFKKHKDTEKEVGMFGSLLIQLPAFHEGGDLLIKHNGKSKKFSFSGNDSTDDCFYSAFYADCEHTLKEVTSGLRIVLAFNLVRTKTSVPVPSNPADLNCVIEHLRGASNAWIRDINKPRKLVWKFEHEYTCTNLSLAGLKGNDKAVADLVCNADFTDINGKSRPLFNCYLALLEKEESGYPKDGGYDDYGDGSPMGEIEDTNFKLNKLVHIGKANDDCDDLEIDYETELIGCYEDEFFNEDPDDQEYEGYQGNYAGTLQYWYRTSALVFWPASSDEVDDTFDTAVIDFKTQLKKADNNEDYIKLAKRFIEIISYCREKIIDITTDQHALLIQASLQLSLNVSLISIQHICSAITASTTGLFSTSQNVIDAILDAVKTYGFEAFSTSISQLISSTANTEGLTLGYVLAENLNIEDIRKIEGVVPANYLSEAALKVARWVYDATLRLQNYRASTFTSSDPCILETIRVSSRFSEIITLKGIIDLLALQVGVVSIEMARVIAEYIEFKESEWETMKTTMTDMVSKTEASHLLNGIELVNILNLKQRGRKKIIVEILRSVIIAFSKAITSKTIAPDTLDTLIRSISSLIILIKLKPGAASPDMEAVRTFIVFIGQHTGIYSDVAVNAIIDLITEYGWSSISKTVIFASTVSIKKGQITMISNLALYLYEKDFIDGAKQILDVMSDYVLEKFAVPLCLVPHQSIGENNLPNSTSAISVKDTEIQETILVIGRLCQKLNTNQVQDDIILKIAGKLNFLTLLSLLNDAELLTFISFDCHLVLTNNLISTFENLVETVSVANIIKVFKVLIQNNDQTTVLQIRFANSVKLRFSLYPVKPKILNDFFGNDEVIQYIKNSNEAILMITRAHINRLELYLQPHKTFSLAMPDALFPDYPQVQEFLHSHLESQTILGFSGINAVRSFASAYKSIFNGNAIPLPVPGGYHCHGPGMSYGGFSVKFLDSGGTGSKAYIKLIKTRNYYNFEEKEISIIRNDLKLLRSLCTTTTNTTTNNNTTKSTVRKTTQLIDSSTECINKRSLEELENNSSISSNNIANILVDSSSQVYNLTKRSRSTDDVEGIIDLTTTDD